MRAVVINAEWAPRAGATLSPEELSSRRAVDGSLAWRHPRWEVADRPEPRISEPDHVIVRSRAVGICGSDVHMFEQDEDGYITLGYRTKFPVTFGHEFAGEVADVGPGVAGVKVGDLVAVEAMNYCGACRPCKLGFLNQCERCEDNGFTLDGGAAEFVLTRERYCWSLDALRDRFEEPALLEIGALMEPTSIVYNGMFLNGGGFLPGRDVAVFGCGPIGLLSIQLARAAGANEIIAFDVAAGRRAHAAACGATSVLDPLALDQAGSSSADAIMETTRSRGVALAVEATGRADVTLPAIEASLDLGGKVIVLGLTLGTSAITTGKLVARAGSICGSMGHLGGGFGGGISLHAGGRMDARTIVSERYSLEDGISAVTRTADRADGKILIVQDQQSPIG